MKEQRDYQGDLASIRTVMERSVKFLSLSGLSGILAGLYALLGAAYAYVVLPTPPSPLQYAYEDVTKHLPALFAIALAVLVASLLTGFLLARQKAKRLGAAVWDSTSQRLLFNLSVPLAAGGIFIIALFLNNHNSMIAPVSLIFYGLALLNASHQLYGEVKYLGYSEIVLGLVASFFPGYGMAFWTIGFGLLHIIYGAVMFKKYDR